MRSSLGSLTSTSITSLRSPESFTNKASSSSSEKSLPCSGSCDSWGSGSLGCSGTGTGKGTGSRGGGALEARSAVFGSFSPVNSFRMVETSSCRDLRRLFVNFTTRVVSWMLISMFIMPDRPRSRKHTTTNSSISTKPFLSWSTRSKNTAGSVISIPRTEKSVQTSSRCNAAFNSSKEISDGECFSIVWKRLWSLAAIARDSRMSIWCRRSSSIRAIVKPSLTKTPVMMLSAAITVRHTKNTNNTQHIELTSMSKRTTSHQSIPPDMAIKSVNNVVDSEPKNTFKESTWALSCCACSMYEATELSKTMANIRITPSSRTIAATKAKDDE
mmetsp:Transcript_48794/g.129335  ORF Transcript_48794/g.129335 Transcript_48794/m.129335 type:complete len:329 (+) Transcript_48794:62-1048(+)